jgi:hypothetical protein
MHLKLITVWTGVLHFIFFHRYFPTIRPSTIDVLNLTLPYVPEPELENAIDTRVYQLTRQLSSSNSPNGGVRGQIAVQFFEKRRRKAGGLGWFGTAKANEDVCWETWRLEITLATPRTESGWQIPHRPRHDIGADELSSRTCQSHPSYRDDAAEDSDEDHDHSQPEQGQCSTHHDERDESISVSDHSQSEDRGRLGQEREHALGCDWLY